MKRKLFVSLAVAAMAASPANADNTDKKPVTVSGVIVAPLELTASAMVMPNVVRPSIALPSNEPDTRVTMACGASGDAFNTVSYTNNGNPYAHGSTAAASTASASSANRGLNTALATGTCATLNVSGQGSYYFLVSFGAVNNPSAPNANVGNVTCTDELGNPVGNSSSAQLKSSGTLAVRCGATTRVTANAGTSYTASFPVTVTYD